MQWPALVEASRRGQLFPLDRTRVRTVGHRGGDEPCILCRSPHLLYIWHCATGAHQPCIGLGAPDQSASQRPSWPSGQLVEINPNPCHHPVYIVGRRLHPRLRRDHESMFSISEKQVKFFVQITRDGFRITAQSPRLASSQDQNRCFQMPPLSQITRPCMWEDNKTVY